VTVIDSGLRPRSATVIIDHSRYGVTHRSLLLVYLMYGLPTALPTVRTCNGAGVRRYKPMLWTTFLPPHPNIEVPNRSVDMDSWERSACYP
jgi:hypothetical protein